MSLESDITKIMQFVTDCTREFVKKHNGGVMPTADEILAKGDSFEFPELQVGEMSSSFFVWDKKHVLVFNTFWNSKETTITSAELAPEQWPLPLKMKLAHSIELRAPDGTTKKIL